ncbi:MAG TPA: hypothetical protein VEI97_15260 [bacterium]|nr:hypothetical protein [bacterium]
MRKWPRYPECTEEQRRALWALDARERRSEKRWRQMVVLTDPDLLAETVTSDRQSTIPMERDQVADNFLAARRFWPARLRRQEP